MFHLEEFCETYHGVQRRADLEAHVVEERILHHFHLLGTKGLGSQFLLEGLDLTDVTAHAEVFLHASMTVVHGDEVQLQVQPSAAALFAQGGFDIGMDGLGGIAVHALDDVQGTAL